MMYQYKCVNGHCKENNVLVTVSKSMMDSSREEICEVCEKELNRVYTSPGIKTAGDGYKS